MDQVFKYMVRVACLTYNHATIIEDALKGFCMQETTFPFVCTIFDDDSSDGEPEVIKNYLNEHFDLENESVTRYEETDDYMLMFAQHKTNRNCYFAVFFLKYNHYRLNKSRMPYLEGRRYKNTKYIAFCEGDDFWNHPNKLQMQVDFLENHPDYGMCHTDFSLSDGSNRTHYQERYPDGNYFPGMLLYENVGIGTLTVLYRKETFDKTPKYYLGEKFVAGDKPLWIELAKEAKIKYFPEVTACYRILPNSASHSQSFEKSIAFREGLQYIRRFYAKKYDIKLTDFNSYYTNLLKVCFQHSERVVAKKYYKEAKAHHAITKRGLLFYLGAKYALFRSLLLFVASRW